LTEDRRKHRREPVDWLDGDPASGRRPLSRDPADAHFRRFGEPTPASREGVQRPPDALACRFEVYRSDKVSLTSTQFAGGDWHWRLCDDSGRTLVDAGGYRDERLCRDAVAILRERAADATLAARP
jgi:uncharacterized protein YegP (UPF0339 family)